MADRPSRFSELAAPAGQIGGQPGQSGAPAPSELGAVIQNDPLTGLANWHLFADRAADALARAGRAGWSTAVVVIDVDRFHEVNDRFGHELGDAVLIEISRRLHAGFRPYDTVVRPASTVARFGADEFVILCEHVTDAAVARSLGDRVVDLVRRPIRVAGQDVAVSAAVGVTLAPPGETDVERLISEADAAMRRAKRYVGDGRVVFTDDDPELGGDRCAAERALHDAFAAGELRLRYQPKVALQTDRIVGAEALLYWEHPERGMVSPAEFIPLAEATGLIVAIGSWVIEEACREAARWRRSFPDIPPLVVSVNVSARQFAPGLVDVVSRALSASEVEPGMLCLELTESVLMDDTEQSDRILEELVALGVSLSIDDFGTGYSSLSYLKRFPLQELKIDRSFIDGLGTSNGDTALVAAIVAMAHALDLWVVAEGVETEDQLQRVRTLGCEQAQGYHLARPGPPEAIDVLLRAERRVVHHRHAQGAQHPDAYRPDRVMVVDDDDTTRLLARTSLAAVGFEVQEAIDGPSALAMAKHIRPDCILLDVAMPNMSGLELCRALRSDPETAACSIVMLTITNDADDKIEAFASGADDYIVKPFTPRSLVSRVQDAMRRRREGVGSWLVVEGRSERSPLGVDARTSLAMARPSRASSWVPPLVELQG